MTEYFIRHPNTEETVSREGYMTTDAPLLSVEMAFVEVDARKEVHPRLDYEVYTVETVETVTVVERPALKWELEKTYRHDSSLFGTPHKVTAVAADGWAITDSIEGHALRRPAERDHFVEKGV